jgi:hypothetical protein
VSHKRIDKVISGLIDSQCCFLAKFGTERVLKRLTGRPEIEDALLRLDVLPKEECLMTAARNLETTHATKLGMQLLRSVFEHIPTFSFHCVLKQ